MDVAEFLAEPVVSLFPSIDVVYSIVNSKDLSGIDEMGLHSPVVPGEISFHESGEGEDIARPEEGLSNLRSPVVIKKRMAREGLFEHGYRETPKLFLY